MSRASTFKRAESCINVATPVQSGLHEHGTRPNLTQGYLHRLQNILTNIEVISWTVSEHQFSVAQTHTHTEMESASPDTSTADHPAPSPEEDALEITLKHGSKSHTFTFPFVSATLADLSTRIADTLSIPPAYQKLLISPKPGLIKGPVHDNPPHATIPLRDIASRKITLLGSTPAQIASLDNSVAAASVRTRGTAANTAAGRDAGKPSYLKAAQPARSRDWKSLHDSTTYTFLQIRPLAYLPRPERSTAFLERLRDDPGIKKVMAMHHWTVPLLTEMNPADHTTHEGRTLGLNRNGGEVIELRLRTDAYDGYRDYKTIRKTLCHELTHNEHGEHNREFWDLCKEVEGEVEKGDWKSGGRAVTEEVFYEGEGTIADHGGWEGGEYVLGGVGDGSAATAASSGGAAALSRREVLAKAAEERMRKGRQSSGDSER